MVEVNVPEVEYVIVKQDMIEENVFEWKVAIVNDVRQKEQADMAEGNVHSFPEEMVR